MKGHFAQKSTKEKLLITLDINGKVIFQLLQTD